MKYEHSCEKNQAIRFHQKQDRLQSRLPMRLNRPRKRPWRLWIRRFILYHHKRHPSEMGSVEITEFLTHLAVDGKVTASTQNQALSGLLFLYRQVLKIELPMIDAVRATATARLPVVLSVPETRRLLSAVPDGTYRRMIELMYGAGLRLLDCCRLRVKDVD